MAPARPYWKGYLKLSLVSCPIALYTATSSTERVAFLCLLKQGQKEHSPDYGQGQRL